ncbi:Putative anti-ECFsigma factor, ChrR [Mycobacteroides abscessus subsp. massiliense]|nr:Putative anti-ECFsigma factor, ChrR [Mycobacteroides abscessus subsp. massiliense]SKD31020.1 Putative anti-ECFsigma factor, ChrR [Mycobacteroides abscessus subsp. massiliense]SKD37674.1 Putative anti-ECFsigma factor, ChrR [Mycobacteroides abscessus subsp. massiliense]SKG12210.1 Putative anti-ECFsigma factor, ChrR [Mycobacteroides abscessus subsp. massiliense]SLD90170.1 Putative anti-ECFsigma factor, ChrR [Mycobacteroides abscessus subsp. massiliense]
MTAAHGDPAQCGPNAPGYAWRSAADVDPIETLPGGDHPAALGGDNGAKALITTIGPEGCGQGRITIGPGLRRCMSDQGCVLFLFYPQGDA